MLGHSPRPAMGGEHKEDAMRTQPAAIEEITRKQFVEYERLRQSGVVNMFSGAEYVTFPKAIYLSILMHYEELDAKWPDVRATTWED